jgi:hypothetical protein
MAAPEVVAASVVAAGVMMFPASPSRTAGASSKAPMAAMSPVTLTNRQAALTFGSHLAFGEPLAAQGSRCRPKDRLGLWLSWDT